MFETLPTASQSRSQASFSTPEDSSSSKHSFEPPTGVYGRAVQQNNPPVENDVRLWLVHHMFYLQIGLMVCAPINIVYFVQVKVTISKSARDKMRQKRENSLKEMAEYKDSEKRERLSQTDPSPARRDCEYFHCLLTCAMHQVFRERERAIESPSQSIPAHCSQ